MRIDPSRSARVHAVFLSFVSGGGVMTGIDACQNREGQGTQGRQSCNHEAIVISAGRTWWQNLVASLAPRWQPLFC